MKKFFSSKFGKRTPVAVLMLALAVALGFLLQDYLGAETTILQRSVYCMGVIGTGVSGMTFLFLGLPGLAVGYLFVLVLLLPRVLPDPWNRYFCVVYLAAILGLLPLLKRRREKKPAQPVQEAPEEAARWDFPNGEAPVFALQNSTGRVFQLLRGTGRLCAYRVGGELRGVDETQVVDPGCPRLLGPKDFSIPIEDIRSIRCTPNQMYGVSVRLKAAGKRRSLVPFAGTSAEALEDFFRRLAPGAMGQEPSSGEPEGGSPARRAKLSRVRIGLLVYIGAVTLPWLFLEVPYRLFSALSLLPFPVTLALICAFPKDVTLTESKRNRGGRVLMLDPLICSGFGLLFRTLLDFNFLAWMPLVLWSLGLAVVVGIVLALFSRECKKLSTLLCTVLLSLFFCFGAVGQVNYLLDFGQPSQTAAVIERMYISTNSKGPDSYCLNLVTEDGTEMELRVGKERYESLAQGDSVTVYISKGALGIPYADAQ